MFLPNLLCTITKKGSPDVYGRVGSGAINDEKCAVVKAKRQSERTTLRADSAASRGHAEEFTLENKILLTAKTSAAIDDKLTVIGQNIRIKLMHPRYSVLGLLDHFEVEGEPWV